MHENVKRSALLFSFVSVVFMIFQLIVYREFAFESAWLNAKRAANISNTLDQIKMGAICNSLERPRCSARIFSELLVEHPGDLEVLSNLAIALVGLKKYKEADPYFKAYFAGGGTGQDVMYWYAKSWRAQGRYENAILWSYNVLYYNINSELATQELFEILHEMKRTYEAQSLLASLLMESTDEQQKKSWQKQYDEARVRGQTRVSRTVASKGEEQIDMQAENFVISESGKLKRRIALPALDGRNFYIPVHNNGKVAGFIHSAETETETQISSEDLSKYGLSAKKISASRVLIKSLSIGPFELKNFEASICENCDSRLGGKLLSKVSAHIDGRGKVPYLVMHEGEE